MMANIVAKGPGKVMVVTSGRQGHPGAQGPRLLPQASSRLLFSLLMATAGLSPASLNSGLWKGRENEELQFPL